MSQATDRWLEVAEAKRVRQIAHQMRRPPKAPTPMNSLIRKICWIVLPRSFLAVRLASRP